MPVRAMPARPSRAAIVVADVLLPDLLARTAASRPDAVALAFGDERLTYAEVADASDRLASLLADRGVGPGTRVALAVPKQPAAIVGMHAVMKTGAAYVPLDIDSPAPRLARILASADPTLVLAVPGVGPRLAELATVGARDGGAGGDLTDLRLPPVVSLVDEPVTAPDGTPLSVATRADWADADPAPDRRVGADDPAHLLFTSGSTGEPKGVVITHRNVVSFVDWAVSFFGIRAGDRTSGHPPLHFDLSTFDIYGAFSAGAELHLVPPVLGLDPRRLVRFIRDRALTQWFSVPTVLTYVAKLDALGQGDLPALERLLWCGEVLPTPVLCHWMRRLPHVRFTNLYGPTEATIASSHHTVAEVPADESEPVPIGRACAGEELLVLDESLAAAPPGEIGDLYIAGVGLSPGYWRDPDKTRAAFLPDPRSPGSGARIYRTGDLARVDPDGVVHFLGRADSQIKSRGYRIELGEIENALNAVDGVRECAVVGVEIGGFEGTTIAAAYATDADVEPPALKAALAASLPTYMLPSRWARLDVLPKNQNGKIDRPALRTGFTTPADTSG